MLCFVQCGEKDTWFLHLATKNLLTTFKQTHIKRVSQEV